MIKLSEWVRRLEDAIESLRKENRDLRSKVGVVADETIQDLQKRIAELSRELKARVEQVENLQDTLKKITKENLELQDKNKRLKSKLKQTVDEYDEDYKTFHRDEDKFYNDNFRKIFWYFLWRDPF